MKRALIALVLASSTIASAAPQHVMVLRAEGTADASSRTTVETHVLRLAKHLDGKIEAGDITLADAAAAAGCNVAEASCKDEILVILGVDELVATTVTSSSGGLTVTVRRLQKGTAPRAAASTLPRGTAPDAKLDRDIGPLFGAGLSTGPLVDAGSRTTPAASQQVRTEPSRPVGPVEEPFPGTTPGEPSDPVATTATAQPIGNAPVDAPAPNRKWQKIGIGVGSGLVLLSFIMWTQASSKQEAIDSAPTNTPADFIRLRELERDADGLAGTGNLFFIAGVVLGGVSGYYYWKKGRAARAQTARVTPTVFPNGAGVVLTFGGGQ